MEMQINDIFEEILGTTLTTYRILREWGADVERLYFFYLYTAKIQKTNRIYATTGFCSVGLDMGEKRVQAAKKFLVEKELIQDFRDKKCYIVLNYIFKRSTLEGFAESEAQREAENQTPAKTDPVQNGTGAENDPQMLKEISFGNKNKMLKENACVSSKKKKEEIYSCPLFVSFWTLYPRKIDKPKAWSEWTKLSDEERSAALEWVKAWLRLWQQFNAEEKSFIIYPERFLKYRRYETETLNSDLSTKLKARMTPGSGNKITAAQIDEAKRKEESMRKKLEQEKAEEERKEREARIDKENVLQFFQSLADEKREEIEREATRMLEEAGIARSKEKYPKIYANSFNSKVVQLTRPLYDNFIETVGA